MFSIKYVFYFIVLSPILSTPHINLYYTSSVSDSDDSELQHDCLRVTGSIDIAYISRQIVSYCMNELPSKFNIEKNDLFPKFTFAELSKQNITSQQLYLWSAPINVIERYQFYLNQLSTLNDLLLANEIFYNCTLPRFGSMCQYEFDYYHSNHSSLYHIILDFYRTYEYNPTDLTCYTHLQCNRGSYRSCLHWTDICDEKLDCRDNGLDEKYCWELEENECNENEYRCLNGQCIPQSFLRYSDHSSPYCLHPSDVRSNRDDYIETKLTKSEPSIEYENVACTTWALSDSCQHQRRNLLFQALFSIKDDKVSNDCWSVMKCIIQVPDSQFNRICQDLYRKQTYLNIINETCPDMMFIPAVPVLFNDIYFAFTKNASENFINSRNVLPYICYNSSHYDDYFVTYSKLIFDNITCYIPKKGYSAIVKPYDWMLLNLEEWYVELKHYDSLWKYTPEICNKSSMYQCANSYKCISIYRLLDGVNDCHHMDDEDSNRINTIHLMKQVERYYFKCSISNKTISKSQVNNLYCDCKVINDSWCEDEDPELKEIRTKISFQTICDGYHELYPMLIDGHFQTDETECEQWLYNNIYTRCDNIWNSPNGADEAGCYISSILNCSSTEHICVSSHTKQFICLHLTKINDGTVDCLGAFDEPYFCRGRINANVAIGYSCMVNHSKCLFRTGLCNIINTCADGEDEQLCERNSSLLSNDIILSSSNSSHRLNTIQFLIERMQYYSKKPLIYFSLDGIENLIENQANNIEYTKFPSSSLINNFGQQKLYCHRGLALRIWLDNTSNSTTTVCLCPPNYYGDRCQYQNQRVSLAIQFKATSHSWQTLFAIVISLIDDDNDKRIIHSNEQFSYLSARDCDIKFNIYLLYSTRPKNASKHYAIHIDIYEKILLGYRNSLLIPIKFPFLPVHRLAFIINIPRNNDSIEKCSKHQCIHGKCIKYWNNLQNATFCQCNRGWSGRYCTIPHICQCSSDSLCIGVDTKHRSVCICPIHRFGPRCLIIERTCTNNMNLACENGGQCIPNDEYIESDQKFTCICPKGFSGKRCEIVENRIVISFHKDIMLSQAIFIHFIQVSGNNIPRRATTFQTIISKQNPVNISWLQPFHLVFIEIPKKNYYLAVVQNNYNRSTIINKTINPSDRCQNINEIFNDTIVQLHLLRRIKYYHLPCQIYSSNLSCFYDDTYLCLCQQFGQQRVANCFEFDHKQTFDCSDQNDCENNGQCFFDFPDCPVRSICMCPMCFYGTKCQFSTSRFGLSLDAILGYHISPRLRLTQQSFIIKITLALTIILIVTGLINSILSIITFKNKIVCEVGCGLYLLGSSITILVTTIIFGLKFLIFILSQLTIISNRSFLLYQCHSIDFLLRICLNMDQWFNACVALERTLTVIKGTRFNKKKSKQAAKYVITILIMIVIGSSVHDPIYRRLIEEENDDEKRIWCIVTYPNNLQIFDSFIHPFHVLVPFVINFLSGFILITKKSHQQSTIYTRRIYKELLQEQFRLHKQLLIAPIVLVILALPRIIIAFAAQCMQSIDDSWIFIVGYFLAFIPSTLTFIVFVLPSKFYKKQFRQAFIQYRTIIQRRLHLIS